MIGNTNRWHGAVALALLAGAVGLFAKRPAVLLLGTIGIAFAAYPRLVSAPEPELAVERTIRPETPEPGDEVDVTLTVRNEGKRWLHDLRLVDGVPPLLPVVDGSPRHATALRPGGETTLQYAIEAKRGKHRFEPITVLTRDVSGERERQTTATTPTVVDCFTPVPGTIVRNLTRLRAGELRTDSGGSGVELHQTREYRPGDPVSRIDWHRFARGEGLTTVEFREERSGAIVLCVDPATGGAESSDVVSRSLAAADRLVSGLATAQNEVGLATIDPSRCWRPPDHGREHARELQQLIDTHPAFWSASESSNGKRNAADLRARLGPNTQVLLVSPLAGEGVVRTAMSLETAGYPVTVVSPASEEADTIGGRLVAVERASRIRTLRNNGIPVVDWRPGERFELSIRRTDERTGGTETTATYG